MHAPEIVNGRSMDFPIPRGNFMADLPWDVEELVLCVLFSKEHSRDTDWLRAQGGDQWDA